MGWLDRIHKVATGLGGGLQAPFGLIKDLSLGAFTDDDEFDGFIGTVYGATVKRGGQAFGNLLGPEEGLGAGIGALPGAVRGPARSVIHPVLQGLETAGREAVREPLTALMTAASLSQAGQGFDLGEGYRIAQDRSLGQAISLAILTEDITDEAEIAEAMGSDWYEAISGTFDAAARLFLEPDVLLGKATRGFRKATVAGEAVGRTQQLGKVGEKLGVGRSVELPAGMSERVGAAIYRHSPEWLAKYGGKTIRGKADVTAALADPRLAVINEQILDLGRQEGIGVPGEATGVTPTLEGPAAVAPPLPEPRQLSDLFSSAEEALPPGVMSDLNRYRLGASAEEMQDTMPRLLEHMRANPAYRERLDRVLDALGVGDEVTVYRGGSISEDFPTTNVSLSPVTAKGFAQTHAQNVAAASGQAIDDEIKSLGRILGREEAVTTSPEYIAAKARKAELMDQRHAIREGAAKAGAEAEPVAFTVPRSAIVGHGDPISAELFVDTADLLRQATAGEYKTIAAEAVDRLAARIRDLAFHDHRDGAFIGRVLAETAAEGGDLNVAWGAVMGHVPSMEALYATKPALAGQISRLSGDQARIAEMRNMVGTLGPDQLPLELPGEVKMIEANQVNAELDALYDVEARIAHNEKANAMVRQMPRISAISEKRSQFTRSEFFQSKAGAPLRVAINMRPRSMIDLNDAAGDAQVTKILRKAKLTPEEQDGFRGAYMAAVDPTARHRVLEQVESASIKAVAARHGITDPKQIAELVERANAGRRSAAGMIAGSRRYDGAGRSYVEDFGDDGVATKIYVPLAVTQEFNHFLTPDLDAVDKVFERHAKELSQNRPVREATTEFLEAYQRLWKPSVLIRAGWPIRVVGEEQLRIMSQIGALLTSGRSAMAAGRYGKDLTVDLVNNATQAARRIPKSERTFRGDLSKADAAARRGLRLGKMNIRGAEVESAFGTNATFAAQYQALNSAKGAMAAVVGTADDLRTGLRTEVMGEWQSLDPSTPGHGEAWEHAVNKQMAGDEMWRQFVEGKSFDEVRAWVDTPAGRRYLRRVPHWRGKVDDWLEFAGQSVADYLPTDGLRALALDGKATAADLAKAVPDAAGRPNVHGAMLAQVTGKSRVIQAMGKVRDQAMKTLGTIPTDILSRQPYFDYHYTAEVRRLIDLYADQGMDLTPAMVNGLEAKARNYALGESKKLLYDMADESELSHMLRFISPFYSAWQEVLTRWTGIATDNPAFVARMHEVWRAPEKMGIVTDEDGNRINADGTAVSPLGDKVEAGRDRNVTMRLLATDNVVGKAIFNDLTRNLPGVSRVEHARFNKDGFNTILQGTPGVGPIVQIPLNEVAKGRPELEDSLKWALPFGASQSTIDMMLPATAKRIKTKAGGEEDRMYSNQLMRIYWDMQVDHNLGKRAEAPSYAEAKRKTDAFYNVRTVASFVSPVAPSFQSPYQPYIDAYRALKEKDPETADELFLQNYGEEFFPLTQSLSKTMDGVPPTLEGAAARKKYQDLVERHPGLGGLIIGAEGAGEFVSAVYQSQLQNRVAPGSSDRQRKAFDFEEANAQPNERLGWIEYGKAMDLIDAERMNRGLPNLQVRGARDLADMKRGVIASLEKKYPEWQAVFNVTDRGAWARKIDGMREIARDDRLSGRREIAGLGEYLDVRDQFIDELAARKAAGGASTLTAASNTDLAGLWAQITTRLTDTNPAFSSVFYRYLERDPLALDTKAEVT